MNSGKIIVTGVTGQDGSYMAEYLLKNTEFSVIGGIRRTSQPLLQNLKGVLQDPRFSLKHLELSDAHSIADLIKKERPDYFINFGASAFVPDSWNLPAATLETNTLAVLHILEAVRTFCPTCRVYHACSSEIFGDVIESPQNEKTEVRPRSVYGVSKAAGRDLVKVYRESYNLYAVSGILFNHESPRRQLHYVSRKVTDKVAEIKRSLQQSGTCQPLELGNLDAKRDWSDAADFVDGVWRMLNQDTFNPNFKEIKDYVLASGETHSIREFVEAAFGFAGIKGAWREGEHGDPLLEIYVPMTLMGAWVDKREPCTLVRVNPQFYRPAEVSLLLGDSSRARAELGWAPKTTFLQLVEKMVANDIMLATAREHA
jgi:GDPmannose 4,6-dehydratase